MLSTEKIQEIYQIEIYIGMPLYLALLAPLNDEEKAQRILDCLIKYGAKNAHGVESIQYDAFAVDGDIIPFSPLYYINTGDTYNETICICDGAIWIDSWGNWFTSEEARLVALEMQQRIMKVVEDYQ